MKFCLIGEKLKHSYSAKIHSSFGLDYSLKEIPPQRLSEFLTHCGYDGFNVTIPYKQSVMPYLSGVSERCKSVGAVNTVKNDGGKLYGFNTDFGGLKYMLDRKNVSLFDKNVLILGSGGASLTAVALCRAEKARSVNVVSRKGECNYANCYGLKDTNVIINATPVGMYPDNDGCPIDIKRFPAITAVADCVYNPFRTRLIAEAESLGITATGGLAMLAEQALLAEDVWLNKKHTAGDTEAVIERLKRDCINLVLTGMPSSGKTTLGKFIAEKLNKPFYDVDEYIYKTYGRTPQEIIKTDGEPEFRSVETCAVKELARLSGAVIACGGGSVLKSENVQALKSNGVLIYVKRDLSELVCDGRPVSESVGIAKLFALRKSVYESTADGEINNGGDIEKVCEELIKQYEIACYKRG